MDFVHLLTLFKSRKSTMLLTLLCLFVAVVVVQFLYYIFVFGKFSFAKHQTATPKRIPISVIVCAKNEEINVRTLIPLLLEQNLYLNALNTSRIPNFRFEENTALSH